MNFSRLERLVPSLFPLFSLKKTYKKFDTVTGTPFPPPPTPPKMPVRMTNPSAAAGSKSYQPSPRQSMLLPEVTLQDLSAAKKQLRPVPEERARKLTVVPEPLQLIPGQAAEAARGQSAAVIELRPMVGDQTDAAAAMRVSPPIEVPPPLPQPSPALVDTVNTAPPQGDAAVAAPPSRTPSVGSILNQNFVSFTSPSSDSNTSKHSERFI